MEKLRAWLLDRRAELRILPRASDRVEFEGASAVVYVNAQASKAERLFAALHECGHVEVHRSRRRAPSRRVAGCSLRELDRNAGRWRPRSTRKRLATLEEEVAAWTRGARLAKKLRIRLRVDAFEACRARALMTYVRWAAR